MERLTIRKAQLNDTAAMAAIHCRSWEAAYPGIITADAIAAKNAGRPAQWRQSLWGVHNNYIALWDSVPAGLLGLFSPCRDKDLPQAGEVGAIYLLPEFWGTDIGRPLLEFGVAELHKLGHDTVTLWVLEQNLRARRFYEKCGFAADGARKELEQSGAVMEVRYRLSVT